MRITLQNKQLLRIAGGINGFFFLLCVIFLINSGPAPGARLGIERNVLKLLFTNSLCWIIDLSLVIFFLPRMPKWRYARWFFFYLPSFAVTLTLAVIIAQSPVVEVLSDDPQGSAIWGALTYVLGVNSLTLVAIELIHSRSAQANFRIENANMQAENARLSMKSLEAQHEKLKNQLHPHFLFNSLSALKTLIRKDPEMAESYLMKLSGFLRFSISHNEQNIVPLEQELKFSIQYLEMQKIRFRDALVYTVEVPPQYLENGFLPVFSLQLVLENAIKHNRLTADRPLCIGMRYIDSGWLLVENNIEHKLTADPASGIGLRNLSDRYKLLAQEDIRIENDAEYFSVYLKIIRP
ncbi:MAG TPA: sensor histidine kinase [Puia sp.]|nr:sensor histidine kinase [Puia sp.]